MGPMRIAITALLFTGALAACAPPPPAARESTSSGQAPPQPAQQRTLVAVIRVEPATLASRPLQEAGVALYLSKRMFNAEIAVLDDKGQPRPYLVEALPQLNTDTWRVSPDGRMETTYRLKPDLTWHDGEPLTSADFVFAWRVYTTRELGVASSAPFTSMDEVAAPDARTFVIRWKRPYPRAADLAVRNQEFPPLPRHILESEIGSAESFPNQPWWSQGYVGLGPFKLDRWEPGAFIEAVAFDKHVGGRARIDRIIVRPISDANTALANILTGEVQLSADTSLRLDQSYALKRQWAPTNAGNVLQHPNQWRTMAFQLRPDYATPRGLLDARVRKALAHAIDKAALNDALYEGQGVPSDFVLSPQSEWGPAVEASVIRYPFDLRRSEQLMTDAGYRKGADGIYANADGRFVSELKTNAAPDNEAEIAAMSSDYRKAGFEVQEAVLPAAQAQDAQVRALSPAMYAYNTNAGEPTLVQYVSAQIPTAENRWVGGNRGAWSSPEFDRVSAAFASTLDRTERARQVAELARIFTEDLPAAGLFFRTQPWAFSSVLTGPVLSAPEANMAWNLPEWEMR